MARFVIVSSIGAQDPDAGPEAMRPYLRAKADADAAVAASGLDWTVVRPGSLGDDPGTGRVDVSTALGRRGPVPRDDVALVLLETLQAPSTIGLTFEVFAGDVPAREAVRKLQPPDPVYLIMKRIVERHLARMRKAQRDPKAQEKLRAHLISELYPEPAAPLKPVRQERIPAEAPDWYFEAELKRSGLWDMMERCYPTRAVAVAVGRGLRARPRGRRGSPASAAISSTTSRGTGESVVTTMTATSLRRPSSAGCWRPTAADEMFTPRSPSTVPTRPIIPGRST